MPLTTRGRAEEFARLVDQGSTAGHPSRHEDLLALVADLRSLEHPEPRPEFVSDLRAELMAEADAVLEVRDPAVEDRLSLPDRVTGPRTHRRLAAAAGAVALVGASGSVAVAAQGSLPGDTLYPVKRALESARIGVAGSDTDRGEQLLNSASRRLDEAGLMATNADPATLTEVEETLATFRDQADEGATAIFQGHAEDGEEAPVQAVRDFTAQSMSTLEVLGNTLPPEARDSLLETARTLSEIDEEAAGLCPDCSGGVSEIPPVLLLSAGEVPDGLASVEPGKDLERTQQPQPREEQQQAEAPELPDLDGPVEGGAGAPQPERVQQTRPQAPKPGETVDKVVGGTLEELTKGLTGGKEPGDEGLVPGLTGTVDDTVEGGTGLVDDTVDDTVDGLLGGLDSSDDDR